MGAVPHLLTAYDQVAESLDRFGRVRGLAQRPRHTLEQSQISSRCSFRPAAAYDSVHGQA
jgi:hypothetical protein